MSFPAQIARTDRTHDRGGYVCSCLRVTECQLLETLAGSSIGTIGDLREVIGAGDGCTACHQRLNRYLEAHRRPAPAARNEADTHPGCTVQA